MNATLSAYSHLDSSGRACSPVLGRSCWGIPSSGSAGGGNPRGTRACPRACSRCASLGSWSRSAPARSTERRCTTRPGRRAHLAPVCARTTEKRRGKRRGALRSFGPLGSFPLRSTDSRRERELHGGRDHGFSPRSLVTDGTRGVRRMNSRTCSFRGYLTFHLRFRVD